MTPAELAQVVKGTGCKIVSSPVEGWYACHAPTRAAKANLLDNLAAFDARDPRVALKAKEILKAAALDPMHRLTPEETARTLHSFVRDHVVYIADGIECFQPTLTTLELGGDCDDSARALVALARSVGLKARIAATQSHAVAQLDAGSGWQYAETTLRGDFGEAPTSALRRLKRAGLVAGKPRKDIELASALGSTDPVVHLGSAPEETRLLIDVKGLKEKTDNAFRWEVSEIARRLETSADYLTAVMSFETAATFSPAIRNKTSGATGLIQFMPKTAAALGTSTDELAGMTALAQLKFVEKYLAPFRGKLSTPDDAYMAVFSPAFVGLPPDHVCYVKGQKGYDQNAGLDKDGDGTIRNAELGAVVRARLEAGAQRPPIAVYPPASVPGGMAVALLAPLGIVGLLLGGLALAGVAALVWHARS